MAPACPATNAATYPTRTYRAKATSESRTLPACHTPPIAPTRELARQLQKWDTVYLSAADAFVVAEALVAAAKKNGWHIPRAAVIANHVHAVVINCPADGPAIRRVLKGNAYAALTEHRGKPLRWWTTG